MKLRTEWKITMIKNFKEIEKLFEELDKQGLKAELFLFGGAALMYQELKTTTKDIDLVVKTNNEFKNITKKLLDLNFISTKPTFEYKRFNLSEIFVRKDFRIDLFEKTICDKVILTKSMMENSKQIFSGNKLKVNLISNEGIFFLKTMTEREGDLEDCINLAKTGINWNNFLEEVKLQSKDEHEVWVTWIGERLDILEEKGLNIPIMKDINKLRVKYYNKLKQKINQNS